MCCGPVPQHPPTTVAPRSTHRSARIGVSAGSLLCWSVPAQTLVGTPRVGVDPDRSADRCECVDERSGARRCDAVDEQTPGTEPHRSLTNAREVFGFEQVTPGARSHREPHRTSGIDRRAHCSQRLGLVSERLAEQDVRPGVDERMSDLRVLGIRGIAGAEVRSIAVCQRRNAAKHPIVPADRRAGDPHSRVKIISPRRPENGTLSPKGVGSVQRGAGRRIVGVNLSQGLRRIPNRLRAPGGRLERNAAKAELSSKGAVENLHHWCLSVWVYCTH